MAVYDALRWSPGLLQAPNPCLCQNKPETHSRASSVPGTGQKENTARYTRPWRQGQTLHRTETELLFLSPRRLQSRNQREAAVAHPPAGEASLQGEEGGGATRLCPPAEGEKAEQPLAEAPLGETFRAPKWRMLNAFPHRGLTPGGCLGPVAPG